MRGDETKREKQGLPPLPPLPLPLALLLALHPFPPEAKKTGKKQTAKKKWEKRETSRRSKGKAWDETERERQGLPLASSLLPSSPLLCGLHCSACSCSVKEK
jgi:hypothetical protein